LANGVELDAGVEILGVLAEHHEVDPFLEVQRVAGIALAGAQADVEVERLPHPHDRRAVDQACAAQRGHQLGLGGLHGLGRDGAEHRGVHLLEHLDGAGRERVALLAPELPADVAMHVLVEHEAGRLHHFDADPVAGHPADLILRHVESSRGRPSPAPVRAPCRRGWQR
jgi:hypothetical protein